MQEAWAIHGVYPTFAWLPDGRSIVVYAKGKIRRIDVEDGTAEIIPFRIQDEREITRSLRVPIKVAPDKFDVKMLRWMMVSPDGSKVVFQALGHLYLKDLPAGKPYRLTEQTAEFEFYPSFSRDGKYVTYTTWHDQHLGSVRVASVDREAGENWIVTNEPGHYIRPQFSPSGKSIVFEKHRGGGLASPLWSRETGIYSVAVRDGTPKRVLRSGSSPQFARLSSRLFFTEKKPEKDADNLQLCSVDLSGNDKRVHYQSTWATDFRISPDGKWIAFIERFHVFVAPFVTTGSTINVGPNAKGLPVARVSEEAGDWIHFSGDSKRLHWGLGASLYSQDLSNAFSFVSGKVDEEETAKPERVDIGFSHKHAQPKGKLALVGARIVTMDEGRVIENGTILIEANRITGIGKQGEVKLPKGVKKIDVSNRTLLPGFIDTHAHGAQASNGMTPQQSWVDYARLAFGVTTIHDPSNNTHEIFAASEMTKAGLITAPRTFSTGTILYGAAGSYHAEVTSLEDAEFHLRRMQAVGAFSVKSYNQPRRDQRQQVVAAARKLGMMVVPEGGSTFMHNMTMIVDGHTGIEHTLPVQTAYNDVMALWKDTGVGYTPTLNVAYGGISGEQYWYQIDDLWLHPRLQTFIPPHVLVPRSRRRDKSPDEDYNHMRVAEIAKQVVDQGGLVQAGGHGQLNGICTHWEMWSFVQGGMTPMQALECGTLNGAKYLGLDADIGSLEVGKLADIVVIEEGADPTTNVRDTEKIEFVVANGRVFKADRMNELGSPVARDSFYWEGNTTGMSISQPRSRDCGCHR